MLSGHGMYGIRVAGAGNVKNFVCQKSRAVRYLTEQSQGELLQFHAPTKVTTLVGVKPDHQNKLQGLKKKLHSY
jgi:hypothetical protein